MKESSSISDVRILSHDSEFSRMLALELRDSGVTVCEKENGKSKLTLTDCDDFPVPDGGNNILFGHREKCGRCPLDWERPFPIREFIGFVREKLSNSTAVAGSETFTFTEYMRTVYLHGKPISLSETEAALLSELLRHSGEPVTREELTEKLFPGSGESMLNVYIHYLRKKLESDGIKRIFSVRGKGYAFKAERSENHC